MIHMMDGRIPVEVSDDDVELAALLLQEDGNKHKLVMEFIRAGLSREKAVCTVYAAAHAAVEGGRT